MSEEERAGPQTAARPSVEVLLREVYARLARLGTPALPRVWDALRVRFAEAWTTYCRARGLDEWPEWDDFPYARPGDLVPLLRELGLPCAGSPAAPDPARPQHPPREGRRRQEDGAAPSEQRPARPAIVKPAPAHARRHIAPMPPLPFGDAPATVPPGTAGPAADMAPLTEDAAAAPPALQAARRRPRRPGTANLNVRQLRLFDEPES